MKDTSLEAEVTNLYPEQVQTSDTLPPSPQTGLNSDLKKLTLDTESQKSLP